MNHGRGNGRKGIIVAKLDFGNGQRIVLINDGNDSRFKQRIEGILRVLISGSLFSTIRQCSILLDQGSQDPYVRNIVSGEKNLSDGLSQVIEETIPQADETTLTDGCQCLLRCEIFQLNFQVFPFRLTCN